MHASDLGLSGPLGSVLTVGGPTGALDLSVITGTGGIVISVGQGFINVDGSSIAGGGGSGSVTSTSIVSANGFAGTVANPTTAPAITITTTASGILKGNGTGIAAAIPGTDYQAPIALTTAGSGGVATLSGNTLNIPQYSGGGSGTVNSGTAGQIAMFPSNGSAVSGTSAPVIPTLVATYGSTTNFDLGQSNNYQVTLAGNPTLTLSNVAAGQRFTLNLIQDGTGSRTVTWFSGITWAGGSAPTLQTSAGAIDTISFWCVSSGVYQGYPTSAPVPGSLGQIPHNSGTTLVGSANAVIDSNACFNIGSSIADPGTPVAGALWPSSTSGGAKFAAAPGLVQGIGGRIYRGRTFIAVTQAAATSLLQSPASSEGSLTIPANTLAVGDVLRMVATGTWGSAGASASVVLGVYLNGVLVMQPFAASGLCVAGAAMSNQYWHIPNYNWLQVLAVGSSGAVIGYANPQAFPYYGGAVSGQTQTMLSSTTAAAGGVTVATNSNALFDIKATWSTAAAGNTIQITSFQLYLDK